MTNHPNDPNGPDLDPPEWAKNIGDKMPKPKGPPKKRPEVERVLLDRSKADNYARCPAMARLIDTGAVMNSRAIACSSNWTPIASAPVVRL